MSGIVTGRKDHVDQHARATASGGGADDGRHPGDVREVMRRCVHRFERLVGFRGSVLLFLALWSGSQAIRLAWVDPVLIGTPTYVYLASVAPLWALAVPWGVCALLCGVQAFMTTDWSAFSLTAGMLVAWAVVYLIGGVRGAIPQAYWACIVQIAVAGLILRLSRWPEPWERGR